MTIGSYGRRYRARRRRVHRRLACLIPAFVLASLITTTAAGRDPRNGDNRPVAAGAVAAAADLPSYGAISNGTVRLGINPQGHIDVLVDGIDQLGLQYMPTGADALIPGCWCEGWGVADLTSEHRRLGVCGRRQRSSLAKPHRDGLRRHCGQSRLDGRDRWAAPRPSRVPAVATAGALSGRSHGREHRRLVRGRRLPPCDGLGRPADGVRRVRDDPGLPPAVARLDRQRLQPRQPAVAAPRPRCARDVQRRRA